MDCDEDLSSSGATKAATATATTTSTTTLTPLTSLEPFLQMRIFSYLALSSRSCLRQCCTKLYRAVEAFDFDLANGDQAGINHAGDVNNIEARQELVAATELERWMTVTTTNSTSSDDEDSEEDSDDSSSSSSSSSDNAVLHVSPGTPDLRRIDAGDFHGTPSFGDDWTGASSSNRKYRYYDKDPKLIDGHILVLYCHSWDGFEAFDLNTGKALEFVGRMNGPDESYVNTAKHKLSLELSHYDGRHGLLAAGMHLTGCRRRDNPHGPFSGPYLTVWDLHVDDESGKNVRLRSDLRKPLHNVCAVSVVAPDKCVVLLTTKLIPKTKAYLDETDPENAVVLQWHRIPSNCDEMSSDPPPPAQPTPPQGDEPTHNCSMSCSIPCSEANKRDTWRHQKEWWDKHLEKKRNDDDDDVEYKWFSGSTTLIQENKVMQKRPINDCCSMHSDGKGMLVVFAGDQIQFWHVGTMSLVRSCQPFDVEDHLDFSQHVYVSNLTSCTIVKPKEKEQHGESYEAELTREKEEEDQQEDNLQAQHSPSSRMPSSRSVNNGTFDLLRCNTETILRHFAHENSAQEREFEQGICGLLGEPQNRTLIRRSVQLPVGSCSPQLECFVRVAFTVHSRYHVGMNQIVVMDVEPFRQVRERYVDGEDFHTEDYAQACLGQSGLWDGGYTVHRPESDNCEQVCRFWWKRGGVFDFPEHAELDAARHQRYFTLLHNSQSEEESERVVREMREMEDKIGRDRTPLSLCIDAHKLVVCTGHEFTIWPVELYQRDDHSTTVSLHGCEDLLELYTGYDAFSIDVGTKPLYVARPLDMHLCQRWSAIANLASGRALDYEGLTADIQTIVQDFVTADGAVREALLMHATGSGREIIDAVLSWRYAVLVTSPTDRDEGQHMLNVFDSLGDWARGPCPPFEAEQTNHPKDSHLADVSTQAGIFVPDDREEPLLPRLR